MAISDRLQRRVALLLAAASLACAPAPRMGETVHIAEESAIIIWDATAKTQHFIRRASFETKAKDFGFLVPTPTVPKLEEADDKAFGHLKYVTRPKIVYREIPRNAKSEAPKAAAATKSAPVKVVATAKVAGYDAVVLEASDAAALNRWLSEHGYASSPELIEWFKPYIEKKWRISAFKISQERPDSNRADAKAVRMSFETDTPFFPYREPASQRSESAKGKQRMLRVFLLADTRFGGTVGADGAWPGETVWSDRIEERDRGKLLEHAKLPSSIAAGAMWLTEFEDRSSPRPGTDDVFFKTGADQTVIKRPDEVVYVHKSFGKMPVAAGSESGWDIYELVFFFVAIAIAAGILFGTWRLMAMLLRMLRSR